MASAFDPYQRPNIKTLPDSLPEQDDDHRAALMAEVEGILPAWLPMLECLQSDNIPVSQKLDVLKRLHPYLSGTSGYHVLPQLVQILHDSKDVIVSTAIVLDLGKVRALCAEETLMDIALGMRLPLFEEADDYPVLIQQDDVVRLRCNSIRMLGLLGDDKVIVPLMSLLNDQCANYRLRLESAEALGRLKNERAVSPLIHLLNDKSESSHYLQESAVKALGMLGDIRALDPLLELFESQQGIRRKCGFLIERIIDTVGKLVDNKGLDVQRDRAIVKMVDALEDNSPSIRAMAVEALGNIGSDEQAPLFQKALFDEQMEVAHAALASLYQVGGIEALKELLEIDKLPHFLREEILDFLLLDAEDEDAI